MAKLETRLLRRLLFDFLKPSSYEGDNPFLISLGGNKYWIYITNLCPAHLKNPDVWRVELPLINIPNNCKSSPYPLILMGYDDENDVCSTWSPDTVKDKLNDEENCCFYSRLSLQQEVSESQEILSLKLDEDNKVVCFPRSMCLTIINEIKSHFSDDSKDNSSEESDLTNIAKSSFLDFIDINNIGAYCKYLITKNGYSEKTAYNYSQAIKRFITKGVFENYKSIFLKYESLVDYKKAFDEFFTIREVKESNDKSNKIHSNALRQYICFLCDKSNLIEDNQIAESPEKYIPQTQDENINWEEKYTDNSGKLTKISNPKLLELLRPVLDTQFPSSFDALKIIQDFYGDKYNQETMEFKDWLALIKNIDWNQSFQSDVPSRKFSGVSSQGSKEYSLKVTYPDGTVLNNRNSTTTFLYVIENSFPDLIKEMNIMVNGVNLISKTQIKSRQKQISSGFFVDVNYKTVKKAEILRKISEELDLGLQIDLIPYINESSIDHQTQKELPTPIIKVNQTEAEVIQVERKKIRVILPNGKVIFSKDVVDTFCSIIKFIGYDRVMSANISIGDRPLITRYDCPDSRKYRKVDNNYYLHVNTSTSRKFDILNQLNKMFSFGLTIEYYEPSQLPLFENKPEENKISSILIPNCKNTNSNKKDIVKVTFPNGKVICHKNVVETIVDVIKTVGPHKVQSLNLTAHNSVSGEKLIMSEVNPRYVASSKPLGEDLYVFTNTSTNNKIISIRRISERLSLNLKVEIIPGTNSKRPHIISPDELSSSNDPKNTHKSFLDSIRKYENYFEKIESSRNHPHNSILLITIIDLISKGRIMSSKINFNEYLENAFESTWRRYLYKSQEFDFSAASSFYRLNKEPFWSFKMDNPIGFADVPTSDQLIESKAYAILQEDFISLAKNIAVRERLRKILLTKLKN